MGEGELGCKELWESRLLMALQLFGALKFSRSEDKKAHKPALFDEAQSRLENILLTSGNVLESAVAGIDTDAFEKAVATIA